MPPIGGGLVGENRNLSLDAHGELAGVFLRLRDERGSEGHGHTGARRAILALAQDAAGAFEMDWYHRHTTSLRDVGRAAAERLTPTIRAAPTFGKDQQRPAVVNETARDVGALASDLVAFDRYRADYQRGQSARHLRSEEIVGSRADNELVAPSIRNRGEHQWSIEVAVMIRREHHGAVDVIETIGADAFWRAERVDKRPHDAFDESCARCSGEGRARPFGVVVAADRMR